MSIKITNEIFIERSIEIYGDLFGYDKLEYISRDKKIILYCKKHSNYFETFPESHYKYNNCEYCQKENQAQKSQENFLNKALQLYGDLYDYSKVVYVGRINKLEIYCNKHKLTFFQTPSQHLKHFACPGCKREYKISKSDLLSTEEFVAKSNVVHNYKFDYSKTVYTGANNSVVIICPIHGEFIQRAQGHLVGKSCARCINVMNLGTEEYIRRAKIVHGDTFDYSEVKYINSNIKVKIICKIHGPFYIVPHAHSGKRMCGCPYCRASKGELKVLNVLKTLNVLYDRQWTFSDCKYKKQLPFDFIVIYDNKFGLIEYQGEQHYKPTRYSKDHNKNLEKFKDCQRNDNIKLNYCAVNEIPLLRLVYNEDETLQTNILNFIDLIKTCGCSFKGDLYAKTN